MGLQDKLRSEAQQLKDDIAGSDSGSAQQGAGNAEQDIKGAVEDAESKIKQKIIR